MHSGPHALQAEPLRTSTYRYLRSFPPAFFTFYISQTTPKTFHGHGIKMHPVFLCRILQWIIPTAAISLPGFVFTLGRSLGNSSIKRPGVRNRYQQTCCCIFCHQALLCLSSKCFTKPVRQERSVRMWLKAQKGTAALICQR